MLIPIAAWKGFVQAWGAGPIDLSKLHSAAERKRQRATQAQAKLITQAFTQQRPSPPLAGKAST